jgi:glycosyltransferase involved in cell wall biosynthesis
MKKVALFTSYFKVGQNMSGMGYRAWEFAQTLSKYYEINIIVPQDSDFINSKNISFTTLNNSNLEKIIKNSDVVFTLPEVDNDVLITAAKLNKLIISDITYNPIESLEKDSIRSSENKKVRYEEIVKQYKLQLLVSDLIVVESHEQRLFMLGALMSLGRIEFLNYERSIDFSHLICEIPVGFNKSGLEKINKKRSKKDNSEKVLLWNGGIWNHYDPSPIIKAMKIVTKIDPKVKLMFMYCSPTKITTDTQSAINLSKKLGLYNKNIFFNEDIITYKTRDALLLSSRAIVCSHPYAIDAMIMRRLRFRDAILYTLPMLTTRGGSLSDIIEKLGIGITFKNDDTESIASDILNIVKNKKYYKKLKDNLKNAQKTFLLENNIKDLLKFIDSGNKAPDTKGVNNVIL